MQSLSFDRAVSFYDETRADPEWVSNAVTDSLINLAQLTRMSRVLEIGIGTGRIALPVLRHGFQVIGIDLSRLMMDELQKKVVGSDFRIAIAQADANGLPFSDAAFDCVYAVHVYHVVANWRDALRDAWRVVKPGGYFLVSYHRHDHQSPYISVRRRLAEMALEYGVDTRRPGAQSEDLVQAELEKIGKTSVVEIARWTEPIILSRALDGLAARRVSETWLIPDDILARVIPRLRSWAQEQYGDLAREVQHQASFAWLVARRE